MNKFTLKISTDLLVIIIGSLISLSACIVFYNLNLHLSNFDALSRLNIARKITDNLTPGFGQFGSVWPFLPQLIMMPFTAITPFWHTGIAGMIMSAPSYIISGYLIYLIVLDITNSSYASVIAFLIFITNINLLLLQTMGMSESIFIALILGAMYSLLRWTRNPIHALFPLVLSGVCLAGACLVRYEGVAFSLTAIAVVTLIVFIKSKDIKITEGMTIFFSTVTLFGLFTWCLYCALIFKDPLYWEKVYTGQVGVISSIPTHIKQEKSVAAKPFKINLHNLETKSLSYLTAIAEMSGIPVFFIGTAGFICYIFFCRSLKDLKPFVILLPLSIVVFMFATFLSSSLPLTVPSLSLKNIANFKTTYQTEFNIRYGILLLPFIVIMTGWLISRSNFLKKIGIVVLIIAIISPLYHNAFLIYQLPLPWDKGSAIYKREYPGRDWLKTNYTGGLILVSAYKHDPIMFQLGYPYKTYIHEGTGKYWQISIYHPEVYAKWIFMADPKDITGGHATGEKDPVTEALLNDPTLNKYFEERFNDGHIDVYQRRDQPLQNNQLTAQTDKSDILQFSGKLIDLKGKPIAGVVISTNDTNTQSNNDGTFSIDVPKGMVEVSFKKTGFATLKNALDFSRMSPDRHIIVISPVQKPDFFRKLLGYL